MEVIRYWIQLARQTFLSPYSWIITGFVAKLTQTGATSGTGTAYPYGAPEITPCF
jgi:hypothetical protein